MVNAARSILVFSLFVLLAARPSAAQNLGACGPGGVDPVATFTVPAPAGALVVIDLTFCPGFSISGVGGPGQVVACGPLKTVSTVAGPGGAVFTIGGCGGGLTPLFACATVTVAGVAAPPLRIGVFDRDCANGVGAGDLALVINDFVNAPAEQRSDYDKSGVVGAGDLAILINVFIAGGSTATCPVMCP
jgi:hypothetical protein